MEAMGYEWPLTVATGTLGCGFTASGQPAVVFRPKGSQDWYAVNGTAKSVGSFKDLNPIWADDPAIPGAKTDIGLFIGVGLSQCHIYSLPNP